MTHVRQAYWIPRLRQMVKRIRSNCHGCKKFHAKTYHQPTAGLSPKDRTEGSRPFEVIDVDFAGPITYKVRANTEGKAYILLLACSLTRTVYIEIVTDMTVDQFMDDVVEKVIDEWESQPLLFNVNHPQYHVKERNCILKIISNLEDSDVTPLPSYEEVQRKINALRSYFVAEKNKTEQSKVSGSGASDVYKSKWLYFDRLSFLADNVTPRGTNSNVGKRTSAALTQDNPNSEANAYDVECAPSAKASKKMEILKTNQLLDKAIRVLNEPAPFEKPKPVESFTADQLFGDIICKQLQTMQEGQMKDLLKMNIQRLIYEAKYPNVGCRQQTGVYNHHLVNTGQFNSSSDMPAQQDSPRPPSNCSMYPRSNSTLSSTSQPSFQIERSFTHELETDPLPDL
eukprot:gene17913-19690_t